MGVLLSQGEVSQVQGAAQREAVVSGQPLAILVAADAHLQDPRVSQDLREAEGQGLLTAPEGLQAHQDTAARVGRHLEEGHSRGAALHRHLGEEDRRGRDQCRVRIPHSTDWFSFLEDMQKVSLRR